MATKRKSKGAYMISAVAEMYEIHPQTLRLYEREGLLKPSRTEGNTRLYTDEDLERLEFILNLARDLGVNIAGIAIILQMRERMEEMNRQMQSFVEYVRTEMLARFPAVPRRRTSFPCARWASWPSIRQWPQILEHFRFFYELPAPSISQFYRETTQALVPIYTVSKKFKLFLFSQFCAAAPSGSNSYGSPR